MTYICEKCGHQDLSLKVLNDRDFKNLFWLVWHGAIGIFFKYLKSDKDFRGKIEKDAAGLLLEAQKRYE